MAAVIPNPTERCHVSCYAVGSRREERSMLPLCLVWGSRCSVVIEDEEGCWLIEVLPCSWGVRFGWCLSQQRAALTLLPVLCLSFG